MDAQSTPRNTPRSNRPRSNAYIYCLSEYLMGILFPYLQYVLEIFMGGLQ